MPEFVLASEIPVVAAPVSAATSVGRGVRPAIDGPVAVRSTAGPTELAAVAVRSTAGASRMMRTAVEGADIAAAITEGADVCDAWMGAATVTEAADVCGAWMGAAAVTEGADVCDAWMGAATVTEAADVCGAWMGAAAVTEGADVCEAWMCAATVACAPSTLAGDVSVANALARRNVEDKVVTSGRGRPDRRDAGARQAEREGL